MERIEALVSYMASCEGLALRRRREALSLFPRQQRDDSIPYLKGALLPAKKASKRPSSKAKVARRPKDAISLLKADHALVDDLFKKFEESRDDSKKLAIAQRICMELKIHTTIEEEIFYPATREVLPKQGDLLDEAEVEHASAKSLISEIESGKPGDELWDAKVTVLSEYIKHHVKEEHTEMFPKVRKTKLDLKALGAQLQTKKDELALSLP
jgi:hemerythrin-like domain-containing protein